ncbi:MAG: hypothetical protein ACKOCT_21620 [Alphaproteobacteria bacterium]
MSNSFASPDDVDTSYTQPANALVMPFDATEGRQSFFVVSNIGGTSAGGTLAGVTTHWSYWSASCDHLADVWACLTLNDTVVVDPTDIRALDAGNEAFGPQINLRGKQGFVVVTAYETNAQCGDGSYAGFDPVDNAIVGTYTLADTNSGASLGADAIGLGLDDGSTKLPSGRVTEVDVQTFRPDSLNLSAVVLLNLKEQAGWGPTQGVEVGPNSRTLTSDLTYYDNTETATSLPGISIGCAEFASLIPGGNGSIIPGSFSGLTAGILRMSGFEPNGIGGDTGQFVYAVYGQAVGQFGAGSNGKYRILGSNQ